MNKPKQLLVEKYRPSTLDGYVFQNKKTEEQIRKWVKDGEIPNLLLYGSPGCGKSTLARILINELDIEPNDVKRVNASLQNGISFIREELEPWLKKISFGKFKIVLLEEADRITAAGQDSLRDITELYSDNVRFIMTANHSGRISSALHSRFQHIEMGDVNLDGILDLVCTIIDGEKITFDSDAVVMEHINAYAPDIRKIINSIDGNTDENGVLSSPSVSESLKDTQEWIDYFHSGKKFSLNELLSLTEGIDGNNFELYFETMYNNLDAFEEKGSTLVLISNYLDRAYRVSNQRLNLDALLYHIEMGD